MLISTRRLIVSYLCSFVLAAPALAEDAKPVNAEAPAAAPASPPGSPAAPASPAVTKGREPRIVHPQVNMAGFSREYRAIPVAATPADEKIHRALRQPAPKHWHFMEAPLRAVVSQIVDDTNVPVVSDVQALCDAGYDLDVTTITQKVPEGMSFAAALRLIFRDIGLTWVVGDEVLTVTTKEKAQERLVVVAYPLPRGFDGSQPIDFQSMIDLVQSTVLPHTWDANGGPGSIRPLDAGGTPLLIVSQTCELHDEVENLLRRIHEQILAEFDGRRSVLRVHHVNAPAARAPLADSLKGVCNDSLGDAGDQDAAVKLVGESVVVLSKSPEFHALAAQTIAAVAGFVEQPPSGVRYGGHYDMGGHPFCWVAREVYGAGDPRWLVFRGWMTEEAPNWLHDAYAAVGSDVAAWLHERPVAKAAIRRLMDVVVEPRMVGLRAGLALP